MNAGCTICFPQDKSVPSSEMVAELSFSLQTEASFTPLESLLLGVSCVNFANLCFRGIHLQNVYLDCMYLQILDENRLTFYILSN